MAVGLLEVGGGVPAGVGEGELAADLPAFLLELLKGLGDGGGV